MAWPSDRSRDGGIDEIPLSGCGAGRLYLCGKHAVGDDPEATLARVGATTLVTLNEIGELEPRYPGLVEWMRANAPAHSLHHPIHDFHAPALDELVDLIDDLYARVLAGEVLLMHCGAGIGRTGTIAVALLMRTGVSMDDALEAVRTHRPMAGPEVGTQTEVLQAFDLVCRSRIIEDR